MAPRYPFRALGTRSWPATTTRSTFIRYRTPSTSTSAMPPSAIPRATLMAPRRPLTIWHSIKGTCRSSGMTSLGSGHPVGAQRPSMILSASRRSPRIKSGAGFSGLALFQLEAERVAFGGAEAGANGVDRRHHAAPTAEQAIGERDEPPVGHRGRRGAADRPSDMRLVTSRVEHAGADEGAGRRAADAGKAVHHH